MNRVPSWMLPVLLVFMLTGCSTSPSAQGQGTLTPKNGTATAAASSANNPDHMAISKIHTDGSNRYILLNFVSTSGVTGSFNLRTHQWHFNELGSKPKFIDIDPIQAIIKDAFSLHGATSAWVDGDWHSSNGGFGPRYVASYMSTASGRAITKIGVVDLHWNAITHMESQTTQYFACPRSTGALYITKIVNRGNTVIFRSEDGGQGSWNLASHRWSFSKV